MSTLFEKKKRIESWFLKYIRKRLPWNNEDNVKEIEW